MYFVEFCVLINLYYLIILVPWHRKYNSRENKYSLLAVHSSWTEECIGPIVDVVGRPSQEHLRQCSWIQQILQSETCFYMSIKIKTGASSESNTTLRTCAGKKRFIFSDFLVNAISLILILSHSQENYYRLSNPLSLITCVTCLWTNYLSLSLVNR